MLLPLHLNLEASVTPPAPEPTVDKGRDAGSGRKPQWWEGEWITPGVDAYLPEKPPEDITPLRPKVEQARKRLKQVRAPVPEYKALHGRLGALTRSITRLEQQAAEAVKAREVESAIRTVTDRYRRLASQMAAVEAEITRHEAAMAHRKRLMAEDDEFIKLIMEML